MYQLTLKVKLKETANNSYFRLTVHSGFVTYFMYPKLKSVSYDLSKKMLLYNLYCAVKSRLPQKRFKGVLENEYNPRLQQVWRPYHISHYLILDHTIRRVISEYTFESKCNNDPK